MQAFIHRENITRFRKLLETTTDQGERKRLEGLLAEEEAELAALEAAAKQIQKIKQRPQ